MTPYVVAETAVVSSTLAFTAKVAAVRRRPEVALLAGGWLVRGPATVDVDLTSRTFDDQVRTQELRKYPPSRQLLSFPGHRRVLWWYVGRSTIRIPLQASEHVGGSDRCTATFIDRGSPRIVPLAEDIDLAETEIPVPIEVRGPTVLLAHDEDPDMADLRQVSLHGIAEDGVLRVDRTSGTLRRAHPTTIDQLRTLRHLARQARRHRPVVERWIAQERSGS